MTRLHWRRSALIRCVWSAIDADPDGAIPDTARERYRIDRDDGIDAHPDHRYAAARCDGGPLVPLGDGYATHAEAMRACEDDWRQRATSP